MRETRVRVLFVGLVIALAAVTVGACGDGDAEPTAPTASATVTATVQTPTATSEPTQTPTTGIEDEVAEAYLAYWDAYADAVLNLDISLVEDFVAGDELEGIRDEIAEYEADGVAARIRVEHDFAVVSVSETEAVVIDQYVNNSFYVDAETKEPEEAEGTGEVIRDTIHLEKVDGRWVVVRGTREQIE